MTSQSATMSTMQAELIVTTLERQARSLLSSASSNGAAEIRACPGWTTTDLVRHVGGIYHFAANMLLTGSMKPEGPPAGHEAPEGEPWDWFDASITTIVNAVSNTDPAKPVWTWTDRRNAGFYHRRMLHETTVHRWDAEAATGNPGTVDIDLAADGIHEIFSVGMRYRSAGMPIEYPPGSVLFDRTDGADRWHVRAMDGTLLVAFNADAGQRADATVRGTAEELYLALWGRDIPGARITGERDVATAWLTVAP